MIQTRKEKIGWWAAAWAVVIAYVAGYGLMIQRDAAVPYWDQAGYVQKVYSLVDKWDAGGAGRWNPARYLASSPANRGVLMGIVPAILWGSEATAHQIAWTWLIERTIFLTAGLWVMTLLVKDTRWICAALCLILGGHWFLSLNQNLYLMDLACASMAVLFTALAGLAVVRRTTGILIWMATAGTAMVLIKPQAAVWVAIVCVIVFGERCVGERNWRKMVQWGWVFLTLLLLMGYLFFSPYGKAVRGQYGEGMRGFWSGHLTWGVASGVMPGWVMIALIIRRMIWRDMKIEKIAWMLIAAVACWLIFSVWGTYVLDPRVIWMVMPLVMCGAMIYVCRDFWFALVANVIAAILFLAGMGVAIWGVPVNAMNFGPVVGPRVVQQTEIPEAGLRDLVKAVNNEVGKGDVVVLVNDEFVEYAAMNLAERWWGGGEGAAKAHFVPGPMGDGGVNAAQFFDGKRQWYLTRTGQVSWNIPLRLVTDMRGMSRLITEPGSPVHPLFEQRLVSPMETPLIGEFGIETIPGEGTFRHDEVKLWQLKRPVTPEEAAKCAKYLLSDAEK